MRTVGENLFDAVDDYIYDPHTNGYTKGHCNPERLAALRTAFLTMCTAPPDATGRLKQATSENESLRGAMQAALLSLEAMVDALVPPARVEEARGHLEDALTALREELDE